MRASEFLRRADTGFLFTLALIAGAIWAFVTLASEMAEGDTHAFDEAILTAMRVPGDLSDPIGPGWLEVMMRDATALGGVGVLTFVVCAAAGWMWLRQDGRSAIYLVAATGLGMLLSPLFKTLFDRPRPDLVPHDTMVSTASFPSGHSLMAAVTWLTLAAIVARGVEERALKAYVIALAIVITLAVGVSRVYLGVHWPTDVLAGWCLGGAWATGAATLASWLAGRGRIEHAKLEPGEAARNP
ncbi:phosphatase PAP2 family protein [Wenxinia marina]|uniref:Membrane-associated phospholipid phosphatase n=1 Tax=Wenxinia marina DSM 24838 TaxID=1123501 RepID=A0A0D0QHM8_9RHOB|nr:phosphatase PAP2 family protein [Wenxinia marina]KIQ70588.1 Membrane-associated phospholipid phosphatase [Wenxinia marina DSM 24838]GGL51905.1 phosphatase PAP2 family protein [Wenxinia marina]